ncbi:MAG TPA: DNA-processing protein DprA [Solirubrobacteraceae bacterium]|nr:DNA-processing protein DprA [Solirubrobacteraceae bacterium]
MTQLETAAVVALLRLGRRPASHYSELVESDGSALAVLERELAQTDDGQTRLALAEGSDELIEHAAADLAGWRAEGVKALTVLDNQYPINLRAVHDRPPLLFVAGQLEDHRDQRSVAVIGSRRASAAGVELAKAVAGHLAERGYTVVSGLAAGIDTAAHTTALAMRARTVAVIGTGHRHAYPPQNAELQSKIAAQGSVVSQFWPDEAPSRTSFPKRNAVMSGITLATVIVEASQNSGARVQARLAQGHGRPVFIARGLLDQGWAQATARRPGVHVFGDPTEITAVLERLTSPGALVA